MPRIRKVQAGSDSFGNVWKHDGDVVDVPHEQAEALLLIEDGQFWLADDERADGDDAPQDDPDVCPTCGASNARTGDTGPAPANPEFSEVHPAAPTGEPVVPGATANAADPQDDGQGAATADSEESADRSGKAADAKVPAKKTAARKTTAAKPQE